MTLGHTAKFRRLLYLILGNKHRVSTKMGRQRNMAQMKKQNNIPEKELNKMETSNLPDAEFKTLVIRMIKEHREKVELTENFNKDLRNIKTEIQNI